MFDLLIKDTMIVGSDDVFKGSIAVKDGKIAEILPAETSENAQTIIDGSGKYLFPGVIDVHVHLNEPGFTWREDFAHGTQAAAVGGVTTVVDMPLQNEPALTNCKIFSDKYQAVKSRAFIDYAFWGGLTNYNLPDIQGLNDSGAAAFKCFLSPVSSDYTSLDLGKVRKALSIIKNFDGVAGFHCEDYSIISYEQEQAIESGKVSRSDFLNSRPLVAELIAVKNIIELSREMGTRVHICHVSHPEVAEEIKIAKAQGVRITAETCPHYLIFNEEDFVERGMLLKCAPPLRSAEDSERLWQYIYDGTLDMIVSDHSPCAEYEKSEAEGAFKAWGGISGLQSGLQIMFDQTVVKRGLHCSLIARAMSKNAAEVFGMAGKKGELKQGYDADMVLLDPTIKWEITADNLKYLNKISAFIGTKGRGLPVCTILRGEIIASEGQITGKQGYGKLIKRIE
ncbi:allantoinase AllB [Clostridium sp. DJ247]|uniref:allantoinase AllB n=1 Tax=Clostridium sp. DJ247 TaxID=2726188 RepID=UPI00162A977F|nr:allantoinase AllB [Clostridium sp. DJ247]MBC2579758.1 allantoinase AllB [Clostridium sp. DJ247]